jgi:hypothetical protein
VRPRRHFGFGRSTRGELNPRAKLTLAQVDEIRARVAAGESKAAVARSLGVHETTVGDIALSKNWAYGEDNQRARRSAQEQD